MKKHHKIVLVLCLVLLVGWPVWEIGILLFHWDRNNPYEYFKARNEIRQHLEEKHPNEYFIIDDMDYIRYMWGYEAHIVPLKQTKPVSFYVELFHRSGGILTCMHPSHRYNFGISPYPLEEGAIP